MLSWILIVMLFYSAGAHDCRIASCREIYLKQGNPTSGNYTIETVAGASVRVFCDFYDDRGYTFIHSDDLHLLTEADLAALHTVNDHIMVRILYTNDTQHDVIMEQLTEFRRYALGFRLSNAADYQEPINKALEPYLYVGFLPRDFAANSETRQGYSAGGVDSTFTNCDGNPNSYLVIFQNPDGLDESNNYMTCCDTTHINHWIDRSQLIPTSREMAEAFYYQHEIHMGGCGGYLSTKSDDGTIDGSSIGLGFEIDKCCDTCMTKKCFSWRRSGQITCNIPEACFVTRVKILQDYSGCCTLGETYGIDMGLFWTADGCMGEFWICFDMGC